MAIHGQQLRLVELARLLLAQVAPYDDVERTVLVFQAEEGDAAGGLWALPGGDQAGYAQRRFGLALQRLARTQATPLAQLCTQETQRVAAQGEAGAGVVGDDVLAG